MRETDIPAAMRLKDAEGWNQTAADWAFYLRHDPELCSVAVVNQHVVGTVMAINYNNEVAWIGMMIVEKPYRKMGISTALLKHVVEQLTVCQSVKLDASPAGSHVYKSLGFVVELELQRMVASELKVSVESRSGELMERIRETDIAQLIDFDSNVFGTNREGLIRHFAVERFESGWITRMEGKTKGFLLVRNGTRYCQIGPLHAVTEDIAVQQFTMAANQLNGQPVTVDIHTDKSAFRDYLLTLGFEKQRPFYRMYLKSNPFPGKPEYQFTLASPEVG